VVGGLKKNCLRFEVFFNLCNLWSGSVLKINWTRLFDTDQPDDFDSLIEELSELHLRWLDRVDKLICKDRGE
jgi:hypothetical protein